MKETTYISKYKSTKLDINEIPEEVPTQLNFLIS